MEVRVRVLKQRWVEDILVMTTCPPPQLRRREGALPNKRHINLYVCGKQAQEPGSSIFLCVCVWGFSFLELISEALIEDPSQKRVSEAFRQVSR